MTRCWAYLQGTCRARGWFGIAKLHFVQTGVESVALQQFFVSAAFANCAPFEDSNQVRAANGGEAVGDDEDGAAGHQIVERTLHEHFGFGVELRGGFVEDENGRVFEQGAGDGEALALAAGEALTAVADESLVSLGHLHDEIVRHGGFGGGENFFFGEIRAAVAEIAPDRVVEKNGFLGDDRHLPTQRTQGDVAKIVAVNADGAGSGGVKTREEIDESGLAGAAGADDCYDCAGGNFERDVAERGGVGIIVAESGILKFDGMRKRRQGGGARRVKFFFGEVQEFESLRRRAQRLHEKLIDAAQAFDGLVGFEEREGEGAEGTDSHAVHFNFAAGVEQDHGDDDGAEDVHDGAGGGHGADPAHIFAEEIARRFAELFDFETFHAESFYDAIAADGFLKDLAEVCEAGAAGFGGAADAAG